MIRVTFQSNDPQPSKAGKIWYFSSKELYLRVWDNPGNWRVEKNHETSEGSCWVRHDRIEQGIHVSSSISDVMFSKYGVIADIWQFCGTPNTMPLLNIDAIPSGKGYSATATLMLSSVWFKTKYGRSPIVEIDEVCSTADSVREKWVLNWRQFCRKTNVTSQFNWERAFKTWYIVRG